MTGAVVARAAGATSWVAAPDGRTWRDDGGAPGSVSPVPATYAPAWSPGCWRAAPSRRRQRCGRVTCTGEPASGCRPGRARWATWPASSRRRCPALLVEIEH